MLITLYKIGGLHFRLLGTNDFHVKAKNERFTAASSRCRHNLKSSLTSSFSRLRQNIAPKSVPHVLHDYFSSFNQSNHWLAALSLTQPSSNLKLPIRELKQRRRQRRRQKTKIWLVDWRKIIVLHVQHALSVAFFDVTAKWQCEILRFWRQREHTEVNLSFSIYTSTALLPVHL